ncbi:MAG: hypothetical protein KC503_04365 [Myxococcales bacterium]|nr:hypothetical protein [Myxococcales bacterium]
MKQNLIVIAVCVTALGCSAVNEDYCDQSIPCRSDQTCDLQTFTCHPTTASGAVDAGDAKRPLGGTCASGAQCQSGFCADGVCCSSSCDGACRTCNGKYPGACELVGNGDDPRGDCAGSDSACAGRCDGAGACRFPDKTQSCGSASCSAGSLEAPVCDGAGGCAKTPTLCDGFACEASGSACKSSCSDNGDCSGTFQCVGGKCVNQLPNGASCGNNDDACASKHCVDGVCCGSASCDACNRCDIAGSEGSCAPLRCGPYTCDAAASPAACKVACSADGDCDSGYYCDANKKCVSKKTDGQSCGTAAQCQSGFCVKEGAATSGVCCNRACGGGSNVCESCQLAGKVGTCTFKPAGTSCGAADVCSDNASTRTSAVTHQQCSGSAASCVPVTLPCAAGSKCNAAKTACATSCAAHGECWEGICDLWDIHGRQNKCAAPADTCHASAGGSGAGSYSSPAGTIQSCLDAQKKYVRVVDGTYTENLVVKAPVALVAPSSPQGAFSGFAYTGKVLVQTANANAALTVDRDAIAGSSKRALVYGLRFSRTNASSAATAVHVMAARLDAWSVGASDVSTSCFHAEALSALRLHDSAASGCTYGVYAADKVTLDVRTTQTFLNVEYGILVVGGTSSLTASDVNAAFNRIGVGFFGAGTVNLDRVLADHNQQIGVLFSTGVQGKVTNLLAFNNGSYGVAVVGNARVDFGNATVAYNNGSGADVSCSGGGSGRFVNSVVWDQSGNSFDSCTFEHSTVRTAPNVFLPSGQGNSTADPRFVDPVGGNFALQPGSPCIDSGSDSGGTLGSKLVPTTDVSGAKRPVKLGSAGSNSIDRGAYERQSP